MNAFRNNRVCPFLVTPKTPETFLDQYVHFMAVKHTTICPGSISGFFRYRRLKFLLNSLC
jgi:hypothetical protein